MPSHDAPSPADAALEQARSLFHAGRHAEGLALVEAALAAHPQSADLWNISGVFLRVLRRQPEALEALERALAIDPAHPGARLNRGNVLVDLGRAAEALAELQALAEANPASAQHRLALGRAHFYLGDQLAARGDTAGEAHLRRSVELIPEAPAPALALIQQLTTSGAADARLDEAAAVAERITAGDGVLDAYARKVLDHVFRRVCAFEAGARLGGLPELARAWADTGLHTAFLNLLPRVRSDDHRRELMAQHRRWGEARMAEAAQAPIRPPSPRGPGEKLRVGLLSADLRNHPVGYFAEPLFDHRDPARAELFCYSLDPRPADAMTTLFAHQASAFRHLAGASAREVAQAIADDAPDVLVDLGGSTGHNLVEAMAWRPTARQASWLGYVHSVGLPAIDGLICDRFNRPTDDALLAEAPWVLPGAYYPLGASTFDDRHVIDAGTAEDRQGALTFGTANNPTKYTRETLRVWAEITAAVPGARFAVIRRECASTAFRANVAAAFAAGGLAPERLLFHDPGAGHMPLYNRIDISLDTLPLTGGTTTVESLWMGVPVVTLKGPALYERLSWSILAHAGLPELAADDVAGYRAAALALASDRHRRRELHATLRARLKASELGDTEGFARGFYAMLAEKSR